MYFAYFIGPSSVRVKRTWASSAFSTNEPLHTQDKSRDHETRRAQKKCPKTVKRHFQNHVVWSHASKGGRDEVICDRALNRLLLQRISIHTGSSLMIKCCNINRPVVRFLSAMVSQLCAKPSITKRWILKNSPGDHET